MIRGIAMHSFAVIVLVAQLPTSPQPLAQGLRLQLVPQDESSRAPEFPAFIRRFRQAVEARDVTSVLAMTWEDIATAPFASQRRGRESFRKYHALDDPKSKFWSVVSDLLAKGAAVDGCQDPESQCEATYPYWYKRFPDDKLDRADHMIVGDENVPMYSAPSSDARIVERLSYEIVRYVADVADGTLQWQEDSLLDGRRGFLRIERLYNPGTGYRMIFHRRPDGFWNMVALVAGD